MPHFVLDAQRVGDALTGRLPRRAHSTGGIRLADGLKRPVRMNARTSGQTSAKRAIELVVIQRDVQAVVVALPEASHSNWYGP